jgi:hypothetical protein
MYKCLSCPTPVGYKEFDDLWCAIEHLRKKHCAGIDIRRPGGRFDEDSHGNVWYCFSCETDYKDHRSFQSNEAMMQHLDAKHGTSIEKCKDDY